MGQMLPKENCMPFIITFSPEAAIRHSADPVAALMKQDDNGDAGVQPFLAALQRPGLTIKPNGDILPCRLPVVLGNVLRDSLREI
jgi:MoaA/NifB/PqqE/SkfB family radical SAM enzyme